MKKLFIFGVSEDNSHYGKELSAALEKVKSDTDVKQISINDLTIEFLLENNIEVVITAQLSQEWFYILKGLNIVSIIFGNIDVFHSLADIVIDCLSNDNNKYFTGEKFSLSLHSESEISEIFNLIEVLEWDSNFFGFPVGYLSCRYLTENINYQIMRFSKNNRLKLIEYLCNCHDDRSVKIAEQNGFHFTDIRLTFSLQLDKIRHYDKRNETVTFAKAGPKDIPSLKIITKDMYKDSRYYYDGNFSIEKLNEFYSGWIEKAVVGTFDDECFCLYMDGRPIGFCTIKYGENKEASIGLFGIDKDYAGNGLGGVLLTHVFNELGQKEIKVVKVVTQGRNYAAQRLYQSVGFRTESTQLWYHKWLD